MLKSLNFKSNIISRIGYVEGNHAIGNNVLGYTSTHL